MMISRKDLWIVQHRETGEPGLLITFPSGSYGFVVYGTYLASNSKTGQAREYSISEIIVLFRPGNQAASRLLKASLELSWGSIPPNDTLPLLPEIETGAV